MEVVLGQVRRMELAARPAGRVGTQMAYIHDRHVEPLRRLGGHRGPVGVGHDERRAGRGDHLRGLVERQEGVGRGVHDAGLGRSGEQRDDVEGCAGQGDHAITHGQSSRRERAGQLVGPTVELAERLGLAPPRHRQAVGD